MIKELITYPDERIKYISADVRKFDDELFELLENMHDTMEHQALDAISAIQIAIPFSAIIIKEGEKILELINARIIVNEGVNEAEEKSAYFPSGFSATIKRYSTIKVVYENRHGELQHLNVNGEFSRRIQQQVDFLFGGTLLDKMAKENRTEAEKKLSNEGFIAGESCPVVFVRDYFKRGAKYLLVLVTLTFILPFFVSPEMRALVYMLDKYALFGVILLMIIYFIYGQYEGKKYKQCTSCQIGNIIGTVLILSFQLLIVSLGVFLWVTP
ncbi:MAG: peptide deformylase [Sulfuricurvum sp.]|uniref:peptide deformylase n=1 Tax=Sulfuricurvum sp. TaxID=2025608 RepID=UPI0025D0D53D|nr:peptide deformylase [Sulfuricurvum sp.]MBV5320826.1 peptide deformylase [Sulfuricurvum sp.]